MPALFAYMIAVALLLGGGYGALNWLAAPEPVKVVATTKPQPPQSPHADDSGASTQARPPQASLSEATKPQPVSKPEVNANDQPKTASNEAASSDKPPPASSLPQPQQSATARQQDAKAAATTAQAAATAQQTAPAQQSDRSARAESPRAEADHAETPEPVTNRDPSVPANHEEEKQSAQAVSPGTPQAVASIAPASDAMTLKRSHVRQASRRPEKRPLEVMTLRTIELPDGRRVTQLVPYRRGNRYRDDIPAVAFDPDE